MHNILIVGGGTAGWMTALLMAHSWRNKPVKIALVESSDIGIIGVGEGSTPSMKRFFATLGITDNEWMPACEATYKVNIRFDGWSPATGVNSYCHPFISQLDRHSEAAFIENCLKRRQGLAVVTAPEQFLFNGYLAERYLQPLASDNFPFRIEYGYHFDSILLGRYLRDHAISLGVTHHTATIKQVEQAVNGDIRAVIADDGRSFAADLFVDCSGFNSLLLQQTLQVPFESFNTHLLNDAAIALPSAALAPLPTQTQATAMQAGWAWQIPLRHRTGNGYVYSSAFLSKDQAETELRAALGLLDTDVNVRHLNMQVGQVRQHWFRNCVAVGLSQGFIEPLEATALHLVQTAVETFIEDYDAGQWSAQFQSRFNASIRQRFEATRDYILAHYVFNTRNDSDYWLAARQRPELPDTFEAIQQAWFAVRDLTPVLQKQNRETMFGPLSWYCLFAGYGVFPPLSPNQPPAAFLQQQDAWLTHGIGSLFAGCVKNFSRANSL
uniref:Tryptophan halogenase n=1 Tax=Rheinheimera sp. BAL341 TaxID=1708203 RepID=A0A486XVS6_9GAMM